MKPIYQMWKMVDVVREREEPKYNDRVDDFVGKSFPGLTPEAKRQKNFFTKRSGSLDKGVERTDLLDSYRDRYYNDKKGYSKRVYGSKKDKVGSVKIDLGRDEEVSRFEGRAEILLEQCVSDGFITPNPKNPNLFYVTGKRGLPFTNPLWGNTHWRTRWFYGVSYGFFVEWYKELGLARKFLLWVVPIIFAIFRWDVVKDNIKELIKLFE